MKIARSAALAGFVMMLSVVGLAWAADAAAEKEAAVKKELKKFSGKWNISSMKTNGTAREVELYPNLMVIYKDDGKFVLEIDGRQLASGAIKVDPSAKPKTLEMTFKLEDGDGEEQKFVGIYEIDDKEYRVCHGKNGVKELPKEFESKEGSDLTLSVMKRPAKDEKKEEKK